MTMQHVLTGVFCSFLLTLTACGGGGGGGSNPQPDPTPEPDPDPQDQTYSVGGMITGNSDGVALSLNGNAQSFTGGAFTFSDELDDGAGYNVAIVASGANESCTIQNENGTIAGADVTNIDVVCEEISTMSIFQYNNTAILGALAAGDFNGDGFDDLAFQIRTLDGHPLGNNLYFIRFAFGTGLGSFSQVFDVASECDRILKRGFTMMAADFDGDNFDDLVCRGGDTGLEVMNGADEPDTVFTTDTFEHGQGYFRAVDFNADGHQPDIFDLGDGQGSPVVEPNFEYFINGGNDDFGSIQSFAILNDIETSLGLSYGAEQFVAADVNGDLRDDLITIGGLRSAIDESLHIAVFTGNAAVGFNLPINAVIVETIEANTPFGEYRDLTSGDFDNDGNIDLAISHGASFVQILLGDGMGGFTDQGQITVGRLPVHIATADFNGDGVIDLVTLNEDSHDLFIAFGFGDGSFGDEDDTADDYLIIPLDSQINPYDLVVTDFDNNALADIAFAESALDVSGPVAGNGSVQIFLNPGQ